MRAEQIIPHIRLYDNLTEEMLRTWFIPWVEIEKRKKQLQEQGLSVVTEIGRTPLPTEFGDFTYLAYGDLTTGEHHNVLVYGKLEDQDLSENIIPVRIHSSCWTNEVAHASNCECRKELEETMARFQKDGCGVLIYLQQEGRGTGIGGKIQQLKNMFAWQGQSISQRITNEGERVDTDLAYKQAGYPSECRDFTPAVEIIKSLGINSLRLITNNPTKAKALRDGGLEVVEDPIHIKPDNEIIASDLQSKAKNLGHKIEPKDYETD